ncbi:hypothetical protein RF11_08716 [Thelohanellus kitauei]|uniref:Uncharacterized protein n=1 Tax=Thelohanellus kitauei TaxID=669202 RepID=A0A0C2M9Q5_THEKT|nr:hypothetical protein RF11_08716 [Thelohanellus kitauei]
MTVINRFKDDKDICYNSCDALYSVLWSSADVYNDHEKLSERISAINTQAKASALYLFESNFCIIVKNCVQGVVKEKDIQRATSCGFLLYVMNHAKDYGIDTNLKINEELLGQALETCRDQLRSYEGTRAKLIEILKFDYFYSVLAV